MTGGFKDHFSGVAAAYRDHRPDYPPALFEALAALAPRRGVAWDCGCGSGQASAGLAEVFDQVVATDPSRQQIEAATPHPRIRYGIAPAEASGLPDASVDLVLVAQAIHWFDLEAFYAEARRVAVPGAILAVVGYGLVRVGPEIDPILDQLHNVTLGPFWPAERRLVIEGYRDLPFPFEALAPPPDLAMEADWDVDRLFGYFGTWSAVGPYRRAHAGADPIAPAHEAAAALWRGVRRVRWPLAIRIGRLTPAGR